MSSGPPSGPIARSRPGPRTRPIPRIQSAPGGASPASLFTPAASPVADPFPVGGKQRSPGQPPQAPRTPYRGFRQPRRSGPGPSWLALVAGALAVLIVLGGVAFGVRQVRSASSEPGIVADTGAARLSPGPMGATQPGEVPGPASAKSSARPSKAATAPQTGANKKVKLGVFLGTSPSDVRQFGDWLGREPDYAVDFSTRSTWSDISNPAYMINAWRGSDYRMVYSVALLPWNGNSSIKAGSRGEYDEHFRTLARNLVAGGQEDAILRLGWEFNLKGWKWSTDNPKEFIGYWRHIVTAMRSVPGQRLKFDWNPNVGETPYEAHLYYPGGNYVDYVGVDVYDVSWTKETYPYGPDCEATCRRYRQEEVWDRLLNGQFGLAYWSDFARSKGKPMSIPEWSMWERPDGHGGGDNPYFVQQMHAFIDDPRNRVAYQGYLQIDGADGKHKLTTLKRGGKVYKSLFAK